MQAARILELLVLLLLANGTPIAAKKLLGGRCSYPVDRNIRFVDGRPLLGHSKTLRGIVLAILVTATGAALMNLGWWLGALVGSAAMAGDLLSSFIKRRLGMPPSSKALGLDQIPEALFPLIVCRTWRSLTFVDITVTVALFFAGEIALSRLLFAWGLRDRPY
jgi:CDP-diglyceride synthetase